MRRFVDLHAHSNASDGQVSPAELVRLAEAKKLAAVALTDHDTTAGLAAAAEAAVEFPHLRFINGIEISARFDTGTLHILGLAIDPQAPQLAELTHVLRDARDQRNPQIVASLQRLGLDISMDDVFAALPPGSVRGPKAIISRVHIAHALRKKGYVASVSQAFERYIGDGAPAYVEKDRLEPRVAISAILAAGGVAVLAHPTQLNCQNDAQLERIVRQFMRAGLNGIEVYHSDHTAYQTRFYLELARRLGLAVTGGSDFHGPAKPDVKLGRPRVPAAALTGRLAELVNR